MAYAIVLSGGGARGIAHLGVLQALDEASIKIEAISGTSAGAIVGAFYSAGYAPKKILDIINHTRFFTLLRPAISTSGLLDIQAISKLFSQYLPQSFEELKTRLVINATNLDTGQTVYFSQGELIETILAASCIPAVFKPVELKGKRYVDGGMLNNLPLEPFMKENLSIIGVHTNPIDDNFNSSSAKQIIERCLLMAISGNVVSKVDQCDYFIEPPLLAKFGGMDLSNANKLYEIGYHYAKEFLSINKLR